MSGILINSWDIASVPCSCLSPASPEGLGLLLPVSRALWYTASLKNPGIRMCHTLLWLWGTWHLLKVPGTHLLTLHTRNLNTHNIALNVRSMLPQNCCTQGVCDLIAIWLQNESFLYQLPEEVNPSQCAEQSSYGVMSVEEMHLSPIQLLTPASAKYSPVLIAHGHKSCFIWYFLEKIYLYSSPATS